MTTRKPAPRQESRFYNREAVVNQFFEKFGPIDEKSIRVFLLSVFGYWRQTGEAQNRENISALAHLKKNISDPKLSSFKIKNALINFLNQNKGIDIKTLIQYAAPSSNADTIVVQTEEEQRREEAAESERAKNEAKREQQIKLLVSRPEIFRLTDGQKFLRMLESYLQTQQLETSKALADLQEDFVKIDAKVKREKLSAVDQQEGYREAIRYFLEDELLLDLEKFGVFLDGQFEKVSTRKSGKIAISKKETVKPVETVKSPEEQSFQQVADAFLAEEAPAPSSAKEEYTLGDEDIVEEVVEKPEVTEVGNEDIEEFATVTPPEPPVDVAEDDVEVLEDVTDVVKQPPTPPPDALYGDSPAAVTEPVGYAVTAPPEVPAEAPQAPEAVKENATDMQRRADVEAFMQLPEVTDVQSWRALYNALAWFQQRLKDQVVLQHNRFDVAALKKVDDLSSGLKELSKELRAIENDAKRFATAKAKEAAFREVFAAFLVEHPSIDLQQIEQVLDKQVAEANTDKKEKEPVAVPVTDKHVSEPAVEKAPPSEAEKNKELFVQLYEAGGRRLAHLNLWLQHFPEADDANKRAHLLYNEWMTHLVQLKNKVKNNPVFPEEHLLAINQFVRNVAKAERSLTAAIEKEVDILVRHYSKRYEEIDQVRDQFDPAYSQRLPYVQRLDQMPNAATAVHDLINQIAAAKHKQLRATMVTNKLTPDAEGEIRMVVAQQAYTAMSALDKELTAVEKYVAKIHAQNLELSKPKKGIIRRAAGGIGRIFTRRSKY